MRIFDTYTTRRKKQLGLDKVEVYQYDDIPASLRTQMAFIMRDALGTPVDTQKDPWAQPNTANQLWLYIFATLARELGVPSLTRTGGIPFAQCLGFVTEADTGGVLDLVDLAFHVVDTAGRGVDRFERHAVGITLDPDSAIAELNHRFQQHGVGYRFANGQLIRIDSAYLHSEAVVPALSLLRDSGFRGAKEEFLKAHEHYRHQRYKEALVECLKAFESTMKTICEKRGWTPPRAHPQAKELIDTLMKNGLIPADLASHFGGLRSALEGGVPTLRNRQGGHGQGAVPTIVPEYLVANALHLTAANIVMLVEADKALP